MELEARCVVWRIRRLRRYLFGVYFLVFTDHLCLQQICKIGETKPRIQRWMEFLSAYNFRLSYRRGQENANADFLSRLPLPPIDEDVSGASALTDPDDLGVYLIRACGLSTPSCPVPGVGLGGLTPSPDIPALGGLAPPPDVSVSGGLPLTQDDFRTHRAPLSPQSMTVRSRRSCAPSPQAPSITYAISARDDTPRPSRRTRSQTAISAGHTPSRPDYRKAAHSGFAAPAASAPRTSPPPRPDRLGYTKITNGRVPTRSPPPSADLRSVPPSLTASLHPTAPDPDIQAAAAHLSNTLLNCSHHGWEQAKREDPLCDATRRHIQLGSPKHSLASLCDHLPSHQRPARQFADQSSPSPCPTALASPPALTTSGLCLLWLEETHTSSYSRTALAAVPTCFAVTTAEFTAEGTADIPVNRFIPLWGCPSTLLSDNGLQFCARLATAVYKLLGIHKLTTSAYHPSGNGGVERVNHTMAQMLAMVCNEHQNDWDVHLPHVEYAYNNSVSAATGLAPNEVHMGRLPRLPLTVFDRSYGGMHQNLDRDQLAYCDFARERQQRAYDLVREQHALSVARVNGRSSALSDVLLYRPQ